MFPYTAITSYTWNCGGNTREIPVALTCRLVLVSKPLLIGALPNNTTEAAISTPLVPLSSGIRVLSGKVNVTNMMNLATSLTLTPQLT